MLQGEKFKLELHRTVSSDLTGKKKNKKRGLLEKVAGEKDGQEKERRKEKERNIKIKSYLIEAISIINNVHM